MTDPTPQLTGEDAELVALEGAQETLLRAAITNADQACFNACQVLFDGYAKRDEERLRLATRLASLSAELEGAREALRPFAHYYDLNDLADRSSADAIEVPVADLRAAYRFLSPNPAPAGRGKKPEPPYPVGAEHASNAKRAGWTAYYDGKPRKNPFPPDRADLRNGFYEGWDAAMTDAARGREHG